MPKKTIDYGTGTINHVSKMGEEGYMVIDVEILRCAKKWHTRVPSALIVNLPDDLPLEKIGSAKVRILLEVELPDEL